MGRASILAWLLLGGCSLVNRPDPNLLDVGDASLDAGVDAPIDRVDAPDAGGPDAPTRPREMGPDCENDADDDGDGAVDCADNDCASLPACCGAIFVNALLQEDWCSNTPPGTPPIDPSWIRAQGSFLASGATSCSIAGTAPATAPNAIIWPECVPIAQGVAISASFIWSPCPDCEAMVALTPVDEAGSAGILEDLAIRLSEDNGNVMLDLTRAGNSLGRLAVAAGNITTTLSLFPGTAEDGRPTIRATLDVPGTGTIGPLDVFDYPRDLIGEIGGCDVAPGLFFGLQTRGTEPRFGSVTVQPTECPNPNAFRPADARPGFPETTLWLEADDFGYGAIAMGAEWTQGGIGGASLVALGPAVPRLRWHYFFDGSNLNRANERDRELDFSIGGASADEPGFVGFTLRRSAGTPMLGHITPTCDGMITTMCGMTDVREPTVHAARMPSGELLGTAHLVWVDRASRTASALVYGAVRLDLPDFAIVGNPVFTAPAPCENPSHPAVLAGDMGNPLLVYVCGETIYGVRVTSALVPIGAPVMIATAASLGFSRGIVDVDGAVSAPGASVSRLHRLWVAGQDSRGITRIAITEGPSVSEDAVPLFRPFTGNPVLSMDDPILAEGCVGTCRITGIGVSREPLPPLSPIVRVVLSITDESVTSTRHAIVPLEQNLP